MPSFVEKFFMRCCPTKPWRSMRVYLKAAQGRLLLLTVLCTMITSVNSENMIYEEEKVHAAFLYNITQFIQWPESAFRDKTTPIKICLLGKTPIASYLEKVTSGEKIKGRSFIIDTISSINNAFDCHILFFTPITARLHSDKLSILQSKPILQISSSNSFVHNGGMLGLVQTGKRIRPVINLAAVKTAHIRISSKLLRLATIFEAEKE